MSVSALFNLQHALLGSFVMATYVAIGNLTAGWEAAGRAGAVQAAVSFVVIGANTAFAQHLQRERGALWAVLGPTLATTSFAAIFHTLGDTPNLAITLAIVAASAAVNFGFLSLLQERFGTIQPLELAGRARLWLREALPAWQYLPPWVMYGTLAFATMPLMLRHRLWPPHLVLANPTLPWGAMEIGSKIGIHERFRGAPQFLEQQGLPVADGVDANLAATRAFLERTGLSYPLVAKPDQGCVGFGVRKVEDEAALRTVLEATPVDYLVQEYSPLPEEYGVFFTKGPGDGGGRITGITHKVIPTVTGDGRSTVRALIETDPRFDANRHALLRHAGELDRIPGDGETIALLVQASHTYGAWFRDVSDAATPELTAWVQRFMAMDPEVRHGRLDVRTTDLAALRRGDPAAVVEFNGCMSEPIHAYDDRHPLRFGLAAFYRCYDDAFRAAAMNRGRFRVPVWRMTRAYLRFFRGKREVMERIG